MNEGTVLYGFLVSAKDGDLIRTFISRKNTIPAENIVQVSFKYSNCVLLVYKGNFVRSMSICKELSDYFFSSDLSNDYFFIFQSWVNEEKLELFAKGYEKNYFNYKKFGDFVDDFRERANNPKYLSNHRNFSLEAFDMFSELLPIILQKLFIRMTGGRVTFNYS